MLALAVYAFIERLNSKYTPESLKQEYIKAVKEESKVESSLFYPLQSIPIPDRKEVAKKMENMQGKLVEHFISKKKISSFAEFFLKGMLYDPIVAKQKKMEDKKLSSNEWKVLSRLFSTNIYVYSKSGKEEPEVYKDPQSVFARPLVFYYSKKSKLLILYTRKEAEYVAPTDFKKIYSG